MRTNLLNLVSSSNIRSLKTFCWKVQHLKKWCFHQSNYLDHKSVFTCGQKSNCCQIVNLPRSTSRKMRVRSVSGDFHLSPLCGGIRGHISAGFIGPSCKQSPFFQYVDIWLGRYFQAAQCFGQPYNPINCFCCLVAVHTWPDRILRSKSSKQRTLQCILISETY